MDDMAGRRKRSLSDDEESDDAMDTGESATTATRPKYGQSFLFLTDGGAVQGYGQPEMTLFWKNKNVERVFESVRFFTDFGARMAVGFANGRVLVYRYVEDMEPIEITGQPALDIVSLLGIHGLTLTPFQCGFCMVGDRIDVWFSRTDDPAVRLMHWPGGSAPVPADARISTFGTTVYFWRMMVTAVECTHIDLATGARVAVVSEPVGLFPAQLIPSCAACIVLRFGAPTCRVSSTGYTEPLLARPFVAGDYVIYNGRGVPLGPSPFGPGAPTWIWGCYALDCVLLSENGLLTFYTSHPSSAASPSTQNV